MSLCYRWGACGPLTVITMGRNTQFLRFMPIAGLFHGQVINVSGLARDAAVARTTINGYLEILEDTLLAVRLPAYEARLRARERKHPKLYWVDPGLARAVKRQLGDVAIEERGALFEGWIFSLLRAYAEERDLYESIAYWSPAQSPSLEVDFVLRRGRELLAIETKSATRLSRSAFAGLDALADLDGVRRRLVVYNGDRSLRTESGIDVWPLAKFLEVLEQNRLWE